MPRYVWKDGAFRDAEGRPMPIPERGEIAAPRVVPDVPAYWSPLSGEIVTSRSQRREEMRKFDVVEAGDKRPLNGGRAKNRDFARKHGLRWEGD